MFSDDAANLPQGDLHAEWQGRKEAEETCLGASVMGAHAEDWQGQGDYVRASAAAYTHMCM